MYINRNILVVSLSPDITAKDSEKLHSELLAHTSEGRLAGVVVDCSLIAAIDTVDAQRIFAIAELARLHQLSTVFCCIRKGVATALVELDLDPEDIQTATSVDLAVQKLGARNRSRITSPHAR